MLVEDVPDVVEASRGDGDHLGQSDSLIAIGHDGRVQRERETS
jgi:hypothetical protein